MSDNTIIGTPEDASPDPSDGGATGTDETRDSERMDRLIASGDVETAVARSRLYALLALGFDRPGADFEAALDQGAFCTDLVAFARAIDDDVAGRALAVGTHVADREQHHGEWASLFGVEEGVTVSPYELTYLPGPLVTNVRQLSDVAGFYAAFDLAIAAEKNDRRDHVCFQLEFLSHLSAREASLRERGDDDGVAVVVDARRQFVEDHIGRWFWRFADEVGAHGDGFYPALADLLAALLESEVDRLAVEPDWVPDDPEVTEWTEDIFGDSGRGCGGCGIDTGAGQEGTLSLDRELSDDGVGRPGSDEPKG